MRLMISLVVFLGYSAPVLASYGSSVSNLDSICRGLLRLSSTHDFSEVDPQTAANFLLVRGRDVIPESRATRITQHLESGEWSQSFLLENREEVVDALASAPGNVVSNEHRRHLVARGDALVKFFAVNLALTIFGSIFMERMGISFTQMIGFHPATERLALVKIGSVLSLVGSHWYASHFFGPSYQEYVQKVMGAIETNSAKPLSYGHHSIFGRSTYQLEMLYAPDLDASRSAPRLLVHLMKRH